MPRDGDPVAYTTPSPGVLGRDEQRLVFVLTAKTTFSAGEGFAFLLQERARAVVIGERTAGAANPGRSYPVNERFEVTVPNGRVRGAVSGGNWEGSGVTPDVLSSGSGLKPTGSASRNDEYLWHRATPSWSRTRWREGLARRP